MRGGLLIIIIHTDNPTTAGALGSVSALSLRQQITPPLSVVYGLPGKQYARISMSLVATGCTERFSADQSSSPQGIKWETGAWPF